MSWNDGLERKNFLEDQRHKCDEYIAAGMSINQIKEMFDFDFKIFKEERIYRMHNLSFVFIEDDDEEKDEIFEDASIGITLDYELMDADRFWWVEEIGNEKIVNYLQTLTLEEIDIITMYVFEGLTQKEIANVKGVSQQLISKKIRKIKNNFSKRL